MSEQLEQLLQTQDTVTPSERFGTRTMTRIRGVDGERSGLPFPWARFAIGAAGVAVAGGALAASSGNATGIAEMVLALVGTALAIRGSLWAVGGSY